MKTGLHFRTLEKLTKIMDMIHTVAVRIESDRSDLYTYDNSPNIFHPIKLFNTREKLVRRQANNRNVHTRLVTYYYNTLNKIARQPMTVVQIAEAVYSELNQAV